MFIIEAWLWSCVTLASPAAVLLARQHNTPEISSLWNILLGLDLLVRPLSLLTLIAQTVLNMHGNIVLWSVPRPDCLLPGASLFGPY